MTRRRFAAFIAVWLAATLVAISTQTLAMDWLINSYRFAAPANPSISYITRSDSTSGNTSSFTFTAISTGTAGSTRDTIIGTCSEDSASAFGVNSVTIDNDGAGGASPVSMTEVVDQGGTARVNCAIYIGDNTSNTTADFVVTTSESVAGNLSIFVWAAYDLSSNTATDTASGGSASTTGAITLDLDVSADGIAVGVCASHFNGTFVWAGMTERTDAAGTGFTATAADTTQATAQTPLTTNCDVDVSNELSGAAASFR